MKPANGEKINDEDEKISVIWDHINKKLNFCCTNKNKALDTERPCLGECAAVEIDQDNKNQCYAHLYLWDNDFNDSGLVAKWFLEAGAKVVYTVEAVLFDGINDIRNGKHVDDNVRPWIVSFGFKEDPRFLKWVKEIY